MCGLGNNLLSTCLSWLYYPKLFVLTSERDEFAVRTREVVSSFLFFLPHHSRHWNDRFSIILAISSIRIRKQSQPEQNEWTFPFFLLKPRRLNIWWWRVKSMLLLVLACLELASLLARFEHQEGKWQPAPRGQELLRYAAHSLGYSSSKGKVASSCHRQRCCLPCWKTAERS